MPGKLALQSSESFWQCGKGRAVAQGPWLALDHRPIVPPIVNRPSRKMMGPFYNPRMFTQDLSLGGITPEVFARYASEAYINPHTLT